MIATSYVVHGNPTQQEETQEVLDPPEGPGQRRRVRKVVAEPAHLPAPWIPSFQCFVIVEKDVPKEHLDHLHNLVAAVFFLERQQVEEGLAQAIMKVIDYLKVEDQPAIRDLMVWITKLFVNGIEPEAVKKLRTLEGAKTMLSELAKKVNQNAIKAAKADTAYLEGKLDTAKAMLKDGVPLQTVIRYTGLTEDQLAREMKKDSGV
jgi:hypothetical protein